jgi:hypothetical protein
VKEFVSLSLGRISSKLLPLKPLALEKKDRLSNKLVFPTPFFP